MLDWGLANCYGEHGLEQDGGQVATHGPTNEKTLEVQGLILVPEVGLEPTRF